MNIIKILKKLIPLLKLTPRYKKVQPSYMDNRIYIGIDPGKTGGIAVMYDELTNAIKTPPHVSDIADEVIKIKEQAKDIQIYAAIEAVHSMPGNSGRSMFTFGQGYGQWLGILACLKIPYLKITPHRWMRFFGKMPKKRRERKLHLKGLAQELYPPPKGSPPITLATADAILIAHYLRCTRA